MAPRNALLSMGVLNRRLPPIDWGEPATTARVASVVRPPGPRLAPTPTGAENERPPAGERDVDAAVLEMVRETERARSSANGIEALRRVGIDPDTPIDQLPFASMTGAENEPPTPGRDAVLAAGRGMGDPGPATAPPPLAAIPGADMAAPGGTEFLGEIERPMAGAGLGPQSATEAEELRRSGEMVGRTMEAGALATPVGRGVQLAGRAGRAVAASPVGRLVSRTLARPGARATAAGSTVAGVTAAGSGEAEPPSRVDEIRGNLRSLRTRRTELTAQQTQIENDQKAFNDLVRNLDQDDDDAVRRLQQMIGASPDGVWRDGTATAVERYRERLRTQLANARADVERNRSDISTAETNLARAEGAERLRENEAGPIERYAPWIGYPVGYFVGSRLRSGLGRYATEIGRTRTQDANALLSGVGRGTIDRRAGRMNQFWTEGGSRRPPFEHVPGRTPDPWIPDPRARRAHRLYRPGAVENFGPIGVVAAAGGGEMAAANYWLNPHERLAAAQAAVRERPNDEAAIQELVAARRAAAFAEGALNIGRGMLLGGGIAELKSRVRGGGRSRPDIGRAESERAAIDRLLSRRNALTDRSSSRNVTPRNALTDRSSGRHDLRGPDGRFRSRTEDD